MGGGIRKVSAVLNTAVSLIIMRLLGNETVSVDAVSVDGGS